MHAPVLDGVLCTSSKAEASSFRSERAAIELDGVLGMCLGCRAAREGEGSVSVSSDAPFSAGAKNRCDAATCLSACVRRALLRLRVRLGSVDSGRKE